VSRINVLVATTSPDVKAEVIAESVAARHDMNLIEGRCVSMAEVDTVLKTIASSARCALVLVARSTETNDIAQRWLAEHDDLVVMYVDVVDDIVRIGLRDPGLNSLLIALRELVERLGAESRERVARIQLRPANSSSEKSAESSALAVHRPLLKASIDWVHVLLRCAVEKVSDENGDMHGFSITRATLLQSLDAPSECVRDNELRELLDADVTLDNALAIADANAEPLAAAARVFGLERIEFRMIVLMLAPELDIRFQRCIGFLLDELGRRVGTRALYNNLLGMIARVRGESVNCGKLTRWLVFEEYAGRPAAADEPLRLDPFLAHWLLGERIALANDPRVRRALRLVPWPGASLLQRQKERAAELIDKFHKSSATQWTLLNGDDPETWRALLELGRRANQVELIRVEPLRLSGADALEIEECARRIVRMTRLSGEPLVIDLARADGSEAEDDCLRLFLATLDSMGCRAAVICRNEARIVRLLGMELYELAHEPGLLKEARVGAVREAAAGVGAYLTEDSVEAIANRYPLRIDGLEQAMRLASNRSKDYDADNPDLDRFTAACKELTSEGVSHLVDRLEPVFDLDKVVLPPDRKKQLLEIVNHVRLAPRVLDGWKFRDRLPYGRGVAALFSGSSGTGKTMAAMGIASQLDIQILRLDLSRVVSKYIGDTEKNIDRVFTDAQRSGAAILIDEADALFGKRSEVKDAHDRYANIEVAFLLQRMEAYEGLAILTTNMRKNLDPAFLRRLRFIVDFPRPDVEARENIWRQCLPEPSHTLDDADFRQLARRIDITGGQIRQISLRAAFIAAAASSQISLEHIAYASAAELAKLGMAPIEIDINQKRRAA
jgi:ATPase family protein associated with various cellular activities (AAA)/winged helix domain-containing protein